MGTTPNLVASDFSERGPAPTSLPLLFPRREVGPSPTNPFPSPEARGGGAAEAHGGRAAQELLDHAPGGDRVLRVLHAPSLGEKKRT